MEKASTYFKIFGGEIMEITLSWAETIFDSDECMALLDFIDKISPIFIDDPLLKDDIDFTEEEKMSLKN